MSIITNESIDFKESIHNGLGYGSFDDLCNKLSAINNGTFSSGTTEPKNIKHDNTNSTTYFSQSLADIFAFAFANHTHIHLRPEMFVHCMLYTMTKMIDNNLNAADRGKIFSGKSSQIKLVVLTADAKTFPSNTFMKMAHSNLTPESVNILQPVWEYIKLLSDQGKSITAGCLSIGMLAAMKHAFKYITTKCGFRGVTFDKDDIGWEYVIKIATSLPLLFPVEQRQMLQTYMKKVIHVVNFMQNNLCNDSMEVFLSGSKCGSGHNTFNGYLIKALFNMNSITVGTEGVNCIASCPRTDTQMGEFIEMSGFFQFDLVAESGNIVLYPRMAHIQILKNK